MILRLSIIFLISMTLCACEAMKSKEQVKRLDTVLKEYDKSLRWSEYRSAANFHVSREEIPLPVDIEHVKKFSVTGIKVLQKTINPEITEAIVLIEISYYNKEYGTVNSIRQEQHWWRVPDKNIWLIESDFPEFE